MKDLPSSNVDVIRDTSSHTGKWNFIAVTSDAVISSMTTSATGNTSNLSLPAGFVHPLEITAIQLTSGEVWLSNA